MKQYSNMLQCKTWAVVGATNNVEKFGYKIFKLMRNAGYEVYAVNPGVTEILGQQCYASLKDLPIIPEAVNVVVPQRLGDQIVQECAELNIKNVWLQPGADAHSVIDSAEKLGLNVVHHACVITEIKKTRGKVI